MNGSILVAIVSIIISVIAIIVSLYSLKTSLKLKVHVNAILQAASLNERIARSLAKVREKPRKRYILFRVESSVKLSEKSVSKALIEAFRRVVGEAGLTASGVHLVYYDEVSKIGAIRIRSDYKYQALAIMGMIRVIDGNRVSIIPLGTSGTLKSVLKRIKKFT